MRRRWLAVAAGLAAATLVAVVIAVVRGSDGDASSKGSRSDVDLVVALGDAVVALQDERAAVPGAANATDDALAAVSRAAGDRDAGVDQARADLAQARAGDAPDRFDPIIESLLAVQSDVAGDLDDPVVEVYARTTRLIEDLHTVARDAESGTLVEAATDLIDFAKTSAPTLTDATEALETTLADTPPPADPDTMLPPWRSYLAVTRSHLTTP